MSKPKILAAARADVAAIVPAIPAVFNPFNDAVAVFQKTPAAFFDLAVDLTDREPAEQNPNLLQIIPYIVLEDIETGEVFSYVRGQKGGETRLHAKFSVGLGGHIETEPTSFLTLAGVIANETIRELNEEVGFNPTKEASAAIMYTVTNESSLVYYDADDVGTVHLGLVFKVKVNKAELADHEYAVIDNGTWSAVNTLLTRVLNNELTPEAWTRLTLRELFLKPSVAKTVTSTVESVLNAIDKVIPQAVEAAKVSGGLPNLVLPTQVEPISVDEFQAVLDKVSIVPAEPEVDVQGHVEEVVAEAAPVVADTPVELHIPEVEVEEASVYISPAVETPALALEVVSGQETITVPGPDATSVTLPVFVPVDVPTAVVETATEVPVVNETIVPVEETPIVQPVEVITNDEVLVPVEVSAEAISTDIAAVVESTTEAAPVEVVEEQSPVVIEAPVVGFSFNETVSEVAPEVVSELSVVEHTEETSEEVVTDSVQEQIQEFVTEPAQIEPIAAVFDEAPEVVIEAVSDVTVNTADETIVPTETHVETDGGDGAPEPEVETPVIEVVSGEVNVPAVTDVLPEVVVSETPVEGLPVESGSVIEQLTTEELVQASAEPVVEETPEFQLEPIEVVVDAPLTSETVEIVAETPVVEQTLPTTLGEMIQNETVSVTDVVVETPVIEETVVETPVFEPIQLETAAEIQDPVVEPTAEATVEPVIETAPEEVVQAIDTPIVLEVADEPTDFVETATVDAIAETPVFEAIEVPASEETTEVAAVVEPVPEVTSNTDVPEVETPVVEEVQPAAIEVVAEAAEESLVETPVSVTEEVQVVADEPAQEVTIETPVAVVEETVPETEAIVEMPVTEEPITETVNEVAPEVVSEVLAADTVSVDLTVIEPVTDGLDHDDVAGAVQEISTEGVEAAPDVVIDPEQVQVYDTAANGDVPAEETPVTQ